MTAIAEAPILIKDHVADGKGCHSVMHYAYPSEPKSNGQRFLKKHIFVVSGPAGCGKSTVASYLSQALNIAFLEGDEYHSDKNRLKMSHGIPLQDVDRWDWLRTLSNEAIKMLSSADVVVVSCSVLKRCYRDIFREAASSQLEVHFLYLKASEALLQARLRARQGHFMKDSMLQSQLEVLEGPVFDETDVIEIDIQQDRGTVNSSALEEVRIVLDRI